VVDATVLSLSGDAGSIRSSAGLWSAFGAAASTAAGDIRRLDSGDFKGDEAETYRDRLNKDLPPHLDTTSEAWSVVASALTAYSQTLESLQSRMKVLASQAADQQNAVNSANSAVADAKTADARHTAAQEAASKALKPGQVLPADTYSAQTSGAANGLSSATTARQSTITAAATLRSEHTAAVDACVAAIRQAKGLRFEEPPGFWGRLRDSVTGWVADHADVLKAISGALKQISSIAGLLAMIPILTPVMGPIAAGTAGASVLIDAAVKVSTGEGSWTDIMLDGASVLPLGNGLKALKGAKNARAAAGDAKAVQSAAGVVADGKTVQSAATGVTGARTAGAEVKGVETVAVDSRTARTVTSDAGAAGSGVKSADAAGSGGAHAESAGQGGAAGGSARAVESKTPVQQRVCASDPIDVVTGEMVMSATDLSLPGVLPLVLGRVHLSSYRFGGLFGRRWASTLDQRLQIDAVGDVVGFVADDGSVLYYPDAAGLPVGGVAMPSHGVRRWSLHHLPDGGWQLADPDTGVTRRFAPADPAGRCVIETISDRNDNRIDFGYDAHGVIETVSHSGGYRVQVRTAAGRVTALIVRDSNVVDSNDDCGCGGGGGECVCGEGAVVVASFGYDDAGNLAAVTDAAGGRSLRFGCDERGRIVRWTDRNDVSYSYTYDEVGRCVGTSGRGRVLSYGFSYLPGRTLVTDSVGSVSEFAFNQARQVVSHTDPLGAVTTSLWDRYDRLLVRTDPLGRSTSYEYDEAGRLVQVTYPDGSRQTFHRNGLGLPVQVVDPTGAVTVIGYDAAGNVLTVTDPAGAVTVCTREASGAVSSVTDPLGAVTTIVADRTGQPTAVTDPRGGRTELSYDRFGRLISAIDPVGGTTTFGWTRTGKLAHRTTPDSAQERWDWDGEGNLVAHTDPTGARTDIRTGIFDLPVGRIGPDGGEYRFGYDTELRLTDVQNPAGLRWRYEYDPAGRLTAETDFNGCIHTYRHDRAGQLVGVVNALGQETTFVYNDVGDLVERSTVEGTTRFGYDRAGRLVDAVSPTTVVQLRRDAAGRVVQETVDGAAVTHQYDPAGRRTTRTTPAGIRSRWTYDPAGHPKSLTTAGHSINFHHDLDGRETLRHFTAGAHLEQTFDAAHRLLTQLLTPTNPTSAASPVGAAVADAAGMAGDPPPWTARNGGSPTVSRHHRYRLDGTLTAIVDQLTGATRHFDLDSSGRVTAVRAAGWSETYAYDTSGNLTSGSVATATFRANNTDPPGAAPTPTPPDRGGREYSGTLITRTGGTTYRYDKQGRTTTATTKRLSNKPQIWHYRYNTHDQMIAATTTDQHWTYTYDPFGRRTSKQQFGADGTITEQTQFTWDGDQLIEQTHTTTTTNTNSDGANTGNTGGESEVTTWEYLPDTWQPISQTVITTNDQQFYAIITDLVGTPTDLVTPDGRRVAWTNAEATLWGAPHRLGNTATKSRANCPLRFPGQYADYETGLHYNRHRYYNPTTARYTTPDPLGLTPAPAPHNYTPNPTRWTDPLGLTPCDPANLQWDEANGGHTIDRHVGKDLEFLKSRDIGAASTFPDFATASRETASNLTQNHGGIRWWLAKSKYKAMTIDGTLRPGSGLTYLKDADMTVESSKIVTALRRDGRAPGGFRIHTSYPER